MALSAAEEEVVEAAYFLDKLDPTWVDRVDVDTLHMIDRNRCVLAQAFGDFCIAHDCVVAAGYTGKRALRAAVERPRGLCCTSTCDLCNAARAYDATRGLSRITSKSSGSNFVIG
jgi:hypothetical protein